jgi:hypothetical protein
MFLVNKVRLSALNDVGVTEEPVGADLSRPSPIYRPLRSFASKT